MSTFEDQIRHEAPHSALAFRETPYRKSERGDLLRDLIALANANVAASRMLIIGASAAPGGRRSIPGISANTLAKLREAVPLIVARTVDPPFKVMVTGTEVDGKTVAVVSLTGCENRPYLLKREISPDMPAGIGWIRRGAAQQPLLRADLDAMYASRYAAQTHMDVRVGFPGETLADEIEISPMPLLALPSALEAGRLKKLLEARMSAKEMLGGTNTHFNRLMHASLAGADSVYDDDSDESLYERLERVSSDCAAADAYYTYEKRAYPLQLAIGNHGDAPLLNGVLRLKLPTHAGFGVSKRLYREDGEKGEDRGGYPIVSRSARSTLIEWSFGSVEPGKTIEIFREPPRVWAREAAAGKTFKLRYTVHSGSLHSPIRDSVRLHIGKLETQ